MIKKKTMNQRLLTSILAIFISMMFSFSAQAASCKGKSESACSADNNCTWVSAYKRKDGAKVSGHCRVKSGKASKQKSSKSSEKQSSADSKSNDKKVKDKKVKDKKAKDKAAQKNKPAKKDKEKKSKDKKSKDKKSS